LSRRGMSIGSHTHTHPVLASLTREAIDYEIVKSRDAIADRIGRRPEAFAYPFGSFRSFDARTRAAIEAHGFKVACTTVAGRNAPTTDPLALRRIRVSWCDGPGEIRRALAGCYDWYRCVQRMQSGRATTAPA
jgi:peptidoglycan/xylan/chitin deacetylase (PgdA/CDA1 family)